MHLCVDEPIAVRTHGGISTMPGSWRSVLRHCYETLLFGDYGFGQRLIGLCRLCSRKIMVQAFGRSALETIQLRRAQSRALRAKPLEVGPAHGESHDKTDQHEPRQHARAKLAGTA